MVSSHRLEELAGLCDKYLFLTSAAPFLFRAHDIEDDGRVTPARLHEVFDMVRLEPTATIAWLRRAARAALTSTLACLDPACRDTGA